MIMKITRELPSCYLLLRLCDSSKQNPILYSMLKMLDQTDFPHLDIDQHFASALRIPGNIRETGKETII
jgi:hypothetical protein